MILFSLRDFLGSFVVYFLSLKELPCRHCYTTADSVIMG